MPGSPLYCKGIGLRCFFVYSIFEFIDGILYLKWLYVIVILITALSFRNINVITYFNNAI